MELIENWENGQVWGIAGWSSPAGLPSVHLNYAKEGSYGALYHATAGSHAQSSSYSNYVDIDMTGHDTLSFWANERYIGNDAGGWGGYFRISVQDAGSWTFNYLDTPSQVWEFHEIDVSGISGIKRITVSWKAVWGNTGVWMDEMYLDYVSTYTLSGTISDEWGNPIRNADINISNGTDYNTTSDENGAYSQVVDADTYDIAVSKSRSTYHDITISSVAVTADTTQDITMLLDKMLGRQNAIKGISIPGGISMGRSRR